MPPCQTSQPLAGLYSGGHARAASAGVLPLVPPSVARRAPVVLPGHPRYGASHPCTDATKGAATREALVPSVPITGFLGTNQVERSSSTLSS